MRRRQENQLSRPTAAHVSVPLFNQKKRNRIPMTSSPSLNEFFSHSEYKTSTSSAASEGASGGYTATGTSYGVYPNGGGACYNSQSVQQAPLSQTCDGNRPAPGLIPTNRGFALMPHPYKAGSTGSKPGPNIPSHRQQVFNSRGVGAQQNKYQESPQSDTAQSKPWSQVGSAQMGQRFQSRSQSIAHSGQQPQWSRTLRPPLRPLNNPPARALPPQNNTWKFTNSFKPQSTFSAGKQVTNQRPTAQPIHMQGEVSPKKPVFENSLRILTASIAGMRHWSQFKDRVSYLFEIFATLDSAVTLGCHGAKTFLMRDGKEVVQCVYYENERQLPRLIRGQVHRCVGNYDQGREVLVCVSIRPALPSEQRNSDEAVKVCDAEMRLLVKSFSEV